MAKAKFKKMFVIRKYIMAKDASDAIRLDRQAKPDDVYIDPEWKDNQLKQLPSALGFIHNEDE